MKCTQDERKNYLVIKYHMKQLFKDEEQIIYLCHHVTEYVNDKKKLTITSVILEIIGNR